MRAKDAMVAQQVIDTWMAAVEQEFGQGWQVSALRARTATVVRDVLKGPDHAVPCMAQFGRELGRHDIDLGFATACLQLLSQSAPPEAASALCTKAAAVALVEGWNAGVSEPARATPPSRAGITPMPVFVQLLRQRFQPPVGRVALVVIDVQQLTCSQLEQVRVRSGVLRLVRAVFSAGQPITEGANGNLVVLLDRDQYAVELVSDLIRRIAADHALALHQLRVWIEPLSTSEMHAEAHVAGIAGENGQPTPLSHRAVPRRGGAPAGSWPSTHPRSSRIPAAFRRDRPTLPG